MFIKRIFNKIFAEETKERLRNKWGGVFERYDKCFYYRGYLKAYKKILKFLIFKKGEPYHYQKSSFLSIIKGEYIKALMLTDPKFDKEKYSEELEWVMENGIDFFPYADLHKEYYCQSDIFKDKDSGLYYVNVYENKLYFKRGYTIQDALSMINGLMNEQSTNSPHRYLSDNVNVEVGDIVFDVGCAEGNFSLEVVGKAAHIYLFEVDEGWIEALKETFEPFKDKVTIVKKMVSDVNDENCVTLDHYMEEAGLDRVDLVKMDVEGCERKVLKGAQEKIKQGKVRKLLVCTYHKAGDPEWISDYLREYELEYSDRYMLMAGEWGNDIAYIRKPYFSRGLIRAKERGN